MKGIITRIVCFAIAMFLFKPFDGLSQYLDPNIQKQLNEARNDVCNERFSDAVAKYHVLVKENENKTVCAEYAYVLALSGCYDGAIMNLDKIIASGQVDGEVLFYISQVLKLMEYDAVADMFWTKEKSYLRAWILERYQSFIEKYRYPASINTDDFGTALQRANELAERHQLIQSMVLFLELIDIYPEEYLPYIGLSALYENLGYVKEAEKQLRKGIEKMGKDKPTIDPSGMYDKHLEMLKSKRDTENLTSQSQKIENTGKNKSRLFTYHGITYMNKALGVNSKFGFYTGETSFFTFGYSFFMYDKSRTYTLDASVNGTTGVLIYGFSISLKYANVGGFGLGLGPCVGLAIPLPGGKSSFDIMVVTDVDIMYGVTASASIGYTCYF